MKPLERHFWNEHDPEDLECKPKSSRGSHEIGGRAPSAPPCLTGPSSTPRPTSFAYISLRTLKPSNVKIDREFRRRKPL